MALEFLLFLLLVSSMTTCAVLYLGLSTLNEYLAEIAYNASRQNRAHLTAVNEGDVDDSGELEVGLYHANEEDANQYMFDKMDELRAANFNPYSDWDWSTGGDKEED